MKAELIITEFQKYNLGPFIEVPCSILTGLINYLLKNKGKYRLINPASEAAALGIAAGCYLANKKIPVVLMQNSGLGNTINCLTSLNQIYKIPVLYVITWRGKPGINDAPEHLIMGAKLKKILDTFDIPYGIIRQNNYRQEIKNIISKIKQNSLPAALILEEGVIDREKVILEPTHNHYPLSCGKAIDIITSVSKNKCSFISTNGSISRDLFHFIAKNKLKKTNPCFYMLGSMGHALPIGIGISMYLKKGKKIIVLDGDGGCLMHIETMATVAKEKPASLIHIVLDNGIYASTGGQPTVSDEIDLSKIARACKYKYIHEISREEKLKDTLLTLLSKDGPSFMHVLINNKSEEKHIRISEKYTCQQIKNRFIQGNRLRR